MSMAQLTLEILRRLEFGFCDECPHCATSPDAGHIINDECVYECGQCGAMWTFDDLRGDGRTVEGDGRP